MTTFSGAVHATPSVAGAFQPGKQALRKEHRSKVICRDSRRFTGSLDLEHALPPAGAGERRWDYGLGFKEGRGRESALWVEIHPASTSEVDTVLAKLRWLRGWLRSQAPRLNALSARPGSRKAFFWL
jgi:hypothetical protein